MLSNLSSLGDKWANSCLQSRGVAGLISSHCIYSSSDPSCRWSAPLYGSHPLCSGRSPCLDFSLQLSLSWRHIRCRCYQQWRSNNEEPRNCRYPPRHHTDGVPSVSRAFPGQIVLAVILIFIWNLACRPYFKSTKGGKCVRVQEVCVVSLFSDIKLWIIHHTKCIILPC